MIIALDYDETYTIDPDFWYNFLVASEARRHYAFICTYRDDRYDKDERLTFLENDGFDIVYTRGVAKKWWCEQFGPGHVDVWIDDKPERIYENSSLSVEGLAEWRNSQKV